MGRFALPLFHTQSFDRTTRDQAGTVAAMRAGPKMSGSRYAKGGTHPEAVAKAHRHTLNLINRELHGNHWKRRGIVGCQSIQGIERHKSGFPHSHAVIGHPDIDLGAPELSVLRRDIRNVCYAEWGVNDLQVAKSSEHCKAYVAKYIIKDGEILLTDRLEALNTGQLSIIAAIASHPAGATPAGLQGLALP
jgi:hypothetical protein